jgi:hypothetical protein
MFCFAEIPTVTHKPPVKKKKKGMNTTIKWRKQHTTQSEHFQNPIEKS